MEKSWTAFPWHRFTRADLEFLAEVLAPGRGEEGLRGLWEDGQALRAMLDLKEVLRALLESTAALRVSPGFYFYVLVRHAFLDAGLEEPAMADYVSALLARRVAAEPGSVEDPALGMTRVAEFLAELAKGGGRRSYRLQVSAGNQFLVLGGLFPGFLERRSERHGAPGLEFYEAFASRSYRDAAGHPQAPSDAPRALYEALAEALPLARRSLNRVAEELLFLSS